MIVTVIRCDRCKKLVDSPPPDGGMTAGYYSGWKDFTNPDEQHVCDSCMWADPRYIEKCGIQHNADRTAIEALYRERGAGL